MIKVRAIARRRWSVLVAGLVLGMLAGIASSLMAPKKTDEVNYRVSQLIIANRMAQQQGNVEQDALRVTRGSVDELARKKLGESDPDALAGSVAAVANTETASIEVSTTDRNPKVATARVEAYVNAFLELVNADLTGEQNRRMEDLNNQLVQAQAELDAFTKANPNVGIVPNPSPLVEQILLSQRSDLKNAVDSIEQQIQQERLNAKQTLPYSTLGPDSPRVVNSDLLPVPAGIPFRAGLLGIFGLALAVGLVMVIERLIPRIDTRDELVAAVELPVLAEVGYFPPRLLPRSPDGTLHIEGAWAEPYRRIRSAIQFVQSESARPEGDRNQPRVFMIASASPGEGKSTTTAVTALAMAETGERTLVVGGDFRRPSIHGLLGVQQSPGIREHARLDVDRPTLDQIVHPTIHPSLYLAPSGRPGKEVVGLADVAKDLITEAVTEGATVLVDTSPIEVANDAIDLLPVVDHVILVVRSGRTVVKSLLHTIDQLNQHGAKIMGTALIGTPGLAKQQYYYEGYYSSGPPSGQDGQLFPQEPVGPAGPPEAAAPPPFQPPGGGAAQGTVGASSPNGGAGSTSSTPLSRPAPPPAPPIPSLNPPDVVSDGSSTVATPTAAETPVH